mgnify:FL=1|tara:strand:- start:369 stop:893 length:525 start_codon:yes stop_codon:yes gene_type:complete
MNLKRQIEALIFISESPISIKALSEVFKIEKSKISTAINELIEEYKNLELSIEIVEVANGYQFRSKDKYKEIIKEYINKKPFKLSRASLEVLGIISKKQPVTKQEIDKIRGVDSTGVINVLLERELINVSGEKNVPGRPFLYKTTEMFLEVFSLKDINDIPDLEEFEEYEKNKI